MERTHERGRFYIGPNGFPRFAGSASGVYLADTVQTELSPSNQAAASGIEEAFIFRNNSDEPRAQEAHFYAQYLLKSSDLLAENDLRGRLDTYFATWHPLFPFLDGAYLLQCFNNAVSMAKLEQIVEALPGPSTARSTQAFEGLKPEESLVLSAIFMAVFTIGGEASPGLPLLRGTSHATMLAHLILGACQNSAVNDLFAVQGLVAIELYLFTTRTLRPAMHLSGTITSEIPNDNADVELAYEAGLHRCPARYQSTFTSPADRDMRRRVFYSLYILDRLLSAEFGIPLMLNDTDVDTCVPGGPERHVDGASPPDHPARSAGTQSEIGSPQKRKRTDDSPSEPRVSMGPPPVPTREDETASKRLLPCFSLVGVTRIMGKAMEAFNKSVKHRSLDPQNALNLRIELESWWNDVGLDPDDEPTTHDPRQNFSTLFSCLYHQQQISLHRAALSLSPSSPHHAYALQSAIASARSICSILFKAFLGASDEECFWPGYVDMLFFSCLIMVYGAKRESEMGLGSGGPRLNRDLKRAVRLLELFAKRWGNLRSFIRVVQTFIKRAEESEGATDIPRDVSVIAPAPVWQVPPATTQQIPVPAQPFTAFPSFSNNQLPFAGPGVNDFATNDFVFDFDGLFELNPETMWAFHQSLPGSPNLA